MSARSKAKAETGCPRNGVDESRRRARVLSEIIERGARVQDRRSGPMSTDCGKARPTRRPPWYRTKLEKQYLAAVMASGAAVGSAAAIPGVGTLAALPRSRRDRGVPRGDGVVRARRRRGAAPSGARTARLGGLVGDDGKRAVADLGRAGPGVPG